MPRTMLGRVKSTVTRSPSTEPSSCPSISPTVSQLQLRLRRSNARRRTKPHASEFLALQDITLHLLLLLFAAAFFAGFIDFIAGGGGMVTVPAMLLAGIPPLQTLGTNKLQSICGAASATIAYARQGHVQLRTQLPMALMAVGGGMLGATLATIMPGDVLRIVLPFLLIAIALYFAFKPNLNDIEKHGRMSATLFWLHLRAADRLLRWRLRSRNGLVLHASLSSHSSASAC